MAEMPSTPSELGRDLVASGDLYRRVLGDAWVTLARQVRGMHAPGFSARGTLTVRHGKSAFARLLAKLSGAPPPSEHCDVTLEVAVSRDRQTWSRTYGRHRVTTRQWIRDGLVVEAYAGLAVHFRLVPDGAGGLVYEQAKTTLEIGPLAIPLPSFLAPRAKGRVSAGDTADEARVDVSVSAPIVGLLVSYVGIMRGSFDE